MMKAAKDEHPEAMFLVAVSYMEGRGVLWDMDEARKWFKKTIEKNFMVDEFNEILKTYYSGGDNCTMLYPSYIYWHRIIETNPDKIKEKEPYVDENGYMNKAAVAKGAAQCGEVNAASLLGFSLFDSDLDKACEYFDIAIRKGYTYYAEFLGKNYYSGNGVERNLKKAEKYFAYGAELGDIRCTLSLGLMYTAEGVSKETEEKGKQLLQSVCEASDEGSDEYKSAKAQLDRIEQRGNNFTSKLSKGLRSLFGKK